MKVSGQVHDSAVLPFLRDLGLGGRGAEPVCTMWRREKHLSLPRIEPEFLFHPARSLVTKVPVLSNPKLIPSTVKFNVSVAEYSLPQCRVIILRAVSTGSCCVGTPVWVAAHWGVWQTFLSTIRMRIDAPMPINRRAKRGDTALWLTLWNAVPSSWGRLIRVTLQMRWKIPDSLMERNLKKKKKKVS
jgi:hypothetical protein